MTHGLDALTEKEKQTLRLLVTGYDAKSMARHLGLSVHTVNERLRDCRRKLGASSSREAARMLRQAEEQAPELLGDKGFGAAPRAAAAHRSVPPVQGGRTARRTGWIIGGCVMTFALGLMALAALSGANNTPAGAPAAAAQAAGTPSTDQAATDAARQFLALVDAGNWQASYAATGREFHQNNTLEGWTAAGKGAHGTLGPALSRELITADFGPAPPRGFYTVRFRSRFAGGRDVVETLALAYEDGAWRVVGLMLD